MHHRYERSSTVGGFGFHLSDQSIVDSIDLSSRKQCQGPSSPGDSMTSQKSSNMIRTPDEIKEENKMQNSSTVIEIGQGH
jgi:hypothetical protein